MAGPDPLGGLIEDLKRNSFPDMFSASSTTVNSVLLHDWWLVKCNVEGSSKRLAVAGYIAGNEFPFTSAPIIKRHDTFTLEAADGIKVKVEGMINQINTQNNGFSAEVCQLFNIGFPLFWEKYTDSCADIAPTKGTRTSQILEHFVTGARGSLNLNPKANGTNMSYNEGPRSNTSEFKPGHEKEDITIKGVSDRARRSRPKKANKIQTDGKQSSSKDTIPESGNDTVAEELPVADIKKANKIQTDGKVSSAKDTMPESENNTGAKELPVADVKQHDEGSILTDSKEAEEFATPEKGDIVGFRKLPTAEKRENAAAESKVSHVGLRSGKGSSKKDHVPQSTTQATGRGLSRTDTKAHEATISPSPSESSIRRSRSGRAIIPTIDKGSQTVVYDEKGNFVGISTPISVSTGSESKRRNAKKRRF